MLRPATNATLVRPIIAVLAVAFAFGIVHSFEHDHHEHVGSDCLACEWSQSLHIAFLALLLPVLLFAGTYTHTKRESSDHLLYLSPLGRSPPAIQ
ncbi:MAG: hypothetical protein CME19_13930 [Gemmatimonadetes bacterium]|nr:hypothetical protein [Gemmatimonadota bacterium]